MRSLSLRDVLDAREAYHVHLLNLPHVVATAVGRYLKRREERPAVGGESVDQRLALTPGIRPPRTLEGSEVHRWSWPVVVVFVDHWMDDTEIADDPDAMVPRLLFLPDGRKVPTCVVYPPPAERSLEELEQHLSFPSDLIGGGYVCLSEVQGRERTGSIACLVTDGDRVFALTNRHVAGIEPGRPMYSMVDGAYTLIGHTVENSVGRLKLPDAYPGFAGSRVELAIDAGLLSVLDLNQWTTQVFGLGVLQTTQDVSPESLTSQVVGTPVRAFGAASGALEGEIAALFYRYATVAGVEYVADALVGPRGLEPLATRPGDSGTLWVIDHGVSRGRRARKVEPLAMQWGGHVMVTDGVRRESPYALVTFISNVCRSLDVEIVTDWNTGHDRYWGEVGHYTVGARACDLVRPAGLREFFVANRTNISFDLKAIVDDEYHTPDGTLFYPLADVPDRVWKQNTTGVGRPHEGPNHFADMDDTNGRNGKTLLALYDADPASLTPQSWISYYKTTKDPKPSDPSHIGITQSKMGLLPFRVAQLYKLMVESLQAATADASERALCAGGVMSHYVGDACQPLHVSRFHDGRDPDEAGVHGGYENTMVTARRKKIISGLSSRLANAGHAIVALMKRCTERLPPEMICQTWVDSDHHVALMWDVLGKKTMDCMADGCKTLAMLWSSAWSQAGASPPAATAANRDTLKGLYMNPDFGPSVYLTEYATRQIW